MLTRLFRASAGSPDESPLEQFFAKPRRPLMTLAIGCFIMFVLHNGERHLWTPDEPRFGQIVKEMLRDGDIFVLHLNGEPYSDKPPLYFYLSALTTLAAGKIQGAAIAIPDEWMMRWPSMAAAIAGIFLTCGIGALLLNRRAGFFAAAAMGLSWTYIWQGRSSQLDMLMCGFIFASMGSWARGAFGGDPRVKWKFLFYAFAALATLSKGPPGFIIPFGAVAVYRAWESNPKRTAYTGAAWILATSVLLALAGSQENSRPAMVSPSVFLTIAISAIALLLVGSAAAWRNVLAQVRWGRHAAGFGLFLVLVFAWLIPAQIKAPPGFSEDQLLGQTLLRYFNPDNHVEAAHYYFEKILTNWLPLTLFLPAALVAAWSRTNPMPLRARRFALSWFLFTFVFFSLSPGKRDQYILPAWPAAALLFGHLFDTASRGWRHSRKWIAIPCGILAAVFIFGGTAAAVPGVWFEMFKEKIEETGGTSAVAAFQAMPFRMLSVPLLAGGVGLVFATIRRDALAGFLTVGFVLQVVIIIAAMEFLPIANGMKSGKEFCEAVEKEWRPSDEIALCVSQETYVYYGIYPVQEISDDAVSTFMERPGRQLAILRRSVARKLKNADKLEIIAETNAGDRDVVCVVEIAETGAPATNGADAAGGDAGRIPSMRSAD